jgi:hypothetical protein
MDTLTKGPEIVDELSFPFFTTKKGEVPFWDHPFLKGNKVLPQKYYPYTDQASVLEMYRRGRVDDTDFALLKVLGDAVCSNEDQLRRYMESVMSRSDTSKRLDRFRMNGLVERWRVRIRGDEESVKPPAPFTLGVAGYKLLKHFYNADFFMTPDRWDKYGIGGIKRYVAMNELRCCMTEKRIVKKWTWNAIIADNSRIKFPMGAAIIKTPQGDINFLIDRAQMNQDYIGYFRERLEGWKNVFEKLGHLPISEFPDNVGIVVIYAATYSMAEHIHQNLMLDTYPYQIWMCVEEDLIQDGFNTAFYRPDKEKLKRIKLDL